MCPEGLGRLRGAAAFAHGLRLERRARKWSVNFFGAPHFRSRIRKLPPKPRARCELAGRCADRRVRLRHGSSTSARTAGPRSLNRPFQSARPTLVVDLALAGTFLRDQQRVLRRPDARPGPDLLVPSARRADFPKGRLARSRWDSLSRRANRNRWFRGPKPAIQRPAGPHCGVPINRRQSIKVYYSTGVVTRTGTDFDTVGARVAVSLGRGVQEQDRARQGRRAGRRDDGEAR